MALVADSTPLMALEALEGRLRKDAQDREDRLRIELKAELKAELGMERDRRVKAERAVQHLSAKLRKFEQTPSEGEDQSDFEAEDRCSPLLMEEVSLMAAPAEGGVKRQSSRHVLLEDSGVWKSLEHMSEGQLDGLDFDYKSLPLDMWGVAIMTLTVDMAEIMRGKHLLSHLTRFLYALGCVVMNLGLQTSILLWVSKYVVGESLWTIQGNYAAFHTDVFDKHGNFEQGKWINWEGPRDELCGAVLTKRVFLGCILFLWIGRMLGEFKATKRLYDDISSLPSVPADAYLHHTILPRNDQVEIIGMTCGTRFVLYVLVVIPKMAICCLLMVIGCTWLTATESFADLILNALALEFVIGIDEQILEFFLPKRATTTVEKTKFSYPSKGPPTDEEELHAMVADYRRNIIYFCLCVCFTCAYLGYMQSVLPHFNFDIGEHCGGWFENRFQPKCPPMQKNCFPYGSSEMPHNWKTTHNYKEVLPPKGN